MFVWAHRAEDKPHRRHFFCVGPVHDRFKRLPLIGVRIRVDNKLHVAVAFVDRAGPLVDTRRGQSVE